MKKIALLILCAAFFAGTGCSEQGAAEPADMPSVENTEEEQDIAAPPAAVGGMMTLSMRTTQTLNPLTNEDETVDRILKLMYEPFVDLDAQYKPVPNIAERWTFSEDGLSAVFQIRGGLYWQDGSQITADDVIFSLQTIQQAGENTVYKKCLDYISGFSKIDNLSVRVNFRQAFSGNLYAMCFPLISAGYYRNENVLTSAKNMNPLGNGPYRFSDFTPAKELRLTRSENSFSSTPYIETIRVVITPDKDTDLYSFDQGITDSISAVETEMGKYDNSKDTRRYEYAINYYDFIGFNFARPLLQDKNIRRAVAFAVPKESIVDSVYLGHAADAQAPVNPASWLYEPETQKYTYNLTLAKTYLEESNWGDADGDHICDRMTEEGQEVLRVSILVNQENEERRQIAARLSDELQAIGFDAVVEAVPYEDYVYRLENGDFDLFLGGWHFSVVPDLSFLFRSNGSSNYISYQSEEMDALLDAAYQAVEETEVKKAYSMLQKNIADELPYVSLVFRNSAVFTHDQIYGEIKPVENNVYANIEEWYIVEQQAP